MESPAWTESIGILRYFGDPMCSWCWGFKPVLEQVEQEYPELHRITILGGLRGESTAPMGEDLMNLVRSAWLKIEQATGQPFNHELWEKHRPLSSTLPACRAVAAARVIRPEMEWRYMVGMFQAYFTQAMDPTHQETHLAVAEMTGYDVGEFGRCLKSGLAENALQEDLQLTRRYGVTGFPAVVLSLNDNNYLISPGYQPIEGMRKAINAAYQDAGIEFIRPESGVYS